MKFFKFESIGNQKKKAPAPFIKEKLSILPDQDWEQQPWSNR